MVPVSRSAIVAPRGPAWDWSPGHSDGFSAGAPEQPGRAVMRPPGRAPSPFALGSFDADARSVAAERRRTEARRPARRKPEREKPDAQGETLPTGGVEVGIDRRAAISMIRIIDIMEPKWRPQAGHGGKRPEPCAPTLNSGHAY